MASKIFRLIRCRRHPVRSLNYHLYSSICAAPVNNSSSNSPEFESAVRFLKNKLHPDRLIRVLDSTSDPALAAGIFRWASGQRSFWQTPETYSRIILKLGMAEDRHEMEGYLKELVRLECPGTQVALEFLISTFCENRRVKEALRVFEIPSQVNWRFPLSTYNVLLGALDAEGGDFQFTMFVYKEMVKAGILPDVESLNYLIKGLCENGYLDSALEQFCRLSKKLCTPNSSTFEILISALCTSGRLDESVKILSQMLELGVNPDVTFYNNIIPIFCRVNRFEEGNKLFLMMRDKNLSPHLYSYSVLIGCLCRNGQPDNAVELFEQMEDLGLPPVTSMYVDIVNGFCCLGELSKALNFLEEKNNSEIEAYNALLRGYCDADRLVEAISFIEKMADRGLTNTLSWNILIRGLSDRGYLRKTFEVLGRMIVSSYMPEQATYSAIIVGYCKLGAYGDALNIFRQVYVNDMPLDSESCSELIEGLCHTKKTQEAAEVFYYITGKGYRLTTNLLNVMIQEICLIGEVEESIRMRSLASCNGTLCIPLTYAPIMLKLLEMKRVKYVLNLLSQMVVEGCTLDLATYCLLIHGLGSETIAREAVLLFHQMIRDSFVPDSITLETLVICMAKCSQLHTIMNDIYKIIDNDGLLSPTVCNIIVSGLLKEGHKLEACKFLDWMLDKDWVPDAETHGLLVGSTKIGRRDGTIEVYKDADCDKVSDILAEGLENFGDHNIQKQ